MTAYPAAIPVLAEAVETIADEIGYDSTADARYIARHLDRAGFDIVPRLTDPPHPPVALTADQRELLLQIAAEETYAEIGRRMYLSEAAVKTRAKHLCEALCAGSRADAVWCAVELGHVTVVDVLAARLHARFLPDDARSLAAGMEP